MSKPNAGMNFCTGLAPAWAQEIRHPDLQTTEFWRLISVVHSADFNEDVVIGVVQNGPGATEQIALAGIRFTRAEAGEVAEALDVALRMAGGDGDAQVPPSPTPGRGPDDEAALAATALAVRP